MESYEKKYKEALERARKLYNSEETSADVEIACETIFPELAESEDELIRKEIIAFLKENLETGSAEETWSLSGLERWISWLEKQGMKEPAAKVESKFNFKVGQWIVATGKCVYLIVKIDGFNVTLVDTNGDEYVFDVSSLDDAHEWSIQEAKDGDVLVNGSNIFIFSHLSDTRAMGYCHINIDDGRFYDDKDKTECFGLIDAVFSPATEEQCNLLFAKMKEAGCQWDAEKKELKKIEQNLASSAKSCKNDTLYDLLRKMPSLITVDGIDYHFVMKKTSIYLAYYACYNGNGEEGRGNAIFGITAHSPIDLLAEMLEILKEKGLLE